MLFMLIYMFPSVLIAEHNCKRGEGTTKGLEVINYVDSCVS